MYSTIPHINFSRFLNGSIQDRQQTVSEINNALRTVGFFYLLNHGIDQDKIDEYFEWVR
jgi:isopenicillin N synthase-like dioxygenase